MSFVSDKAALMLLEDRVTEIGSGRARVFRVAGDHGMYTVVLHPRFESCSCVAQGRCSHIVAAHGLAEGVAT
jgi:hypothetical protein